MHGNNIFAKDIKIIMIVLVKLMIIINDDVEESDGCERVR
jgi:hypothetical protein